MSKSGKQNREVVNAIMDLPVKRELDFSNLPYDVVIEILSRLSLMDFLRCKYISKYWYDSISALEFAKLHLRNAPFGILTFLKENRGRKSRRLRFVQLRDGSCSDWEPPFKLLWKKQFGPRSHIPMMTMVDLQACNGLVCIRTRDPPMRNLNPIYVCNPILGEYIMIPVPQGFKHPLNCTVFAFGFSDASNQYKVIQTFENSQRQLDTMCHTIGGREWRRIDYTPDRPVNMPFNSLLNGALHWIDYHHLQGYQIRCFDTESEVLGLLTPPAVLPLDRYSQIGVLEGSLCLCFCVEYTELEIWVMTDYNNKESWTRKIRIQSLFASNRYRGPRLQSYEPLLLLHGGCILMLHGDAAILWYNHRTERFRVATSIMSYRHGIISVGYKPSFIPLSSIPGVAQICKCREN